MKRAVFGHPGMSSFFFLSLLIIGAIYCLSKRKVLIRSVPFHIYIFYISFDEVKSFRFGSSTVQTFTNACTQYMHSAVRTNQDHHRQRMQTTWKHISWIIVNSNAAFRQFLNFTSKLHVVQGEMPVPRSITSSLKFFRNKIDVQHF